MPAETQDKFRYTIIVDGRLIGVAKTCSEFHTPASLNKSRAYPGAPLRTKPARSVPDDITATIEYASLQVDDAWLLSRSGRGRITITRQGLDVDDNAWGPPLTATGRLSDADPGGAGDVMGSDDALLTLVCATESIA